MKKSNNLSVSQKNKTNFKLYIFGFLFLISVSGAFGQAFTTSWPLSANLSATSTGAVTPATAVINSPLFSTSISFSGAGLLGTGTGGKAVTSCSNTFNSVGSTMIYPYMEFRVSPLAGNYLTIEPFSFTASSSTNLSSGMSINAGYSIDGGTTFTALTFTTVSTGATANSLLVGSVFSTTNATTFTISSSSILSLPPNKDFIVRLIYWRNNASSTTGNPITISSLNLSGFSCPGSLTATPTSLSNFNALPTSASASQSFSVAGSTLIGNVAVTPPTGYEINNPAVDGNYYSSITLTPSSGTLASTSLNIRIKTGQATGVYIGNVTITNSNAPTQIVSLSGASYTNYYYNGIGPLHSLTSWGLNTDGTGTNPPDFGSTTYAQAFYILNTTNVSTSAPWNIGSLSISTANKVIVGDGISPAITFTITLNNPLKIRTNSKFNVLAPSSGNNEIIFQDSSIPTVNSPDISTNLTYAVNGANVGVSGSTYNQLKITNACTVTLATSPIVKYLIVDLGASLIAPSSNFITLSTSGNAIINGTIAGARSQGIFTTDPTSTSKGTVFSTDTNAMMTLGCSSTVIYNRGGSNISSSTQNLSPLNYANLTISNDTMPSYTTVKLTSGTTRINGLLSFTGTANNYFLVNSGTLIFGLNASINTVNGTIDLGGAIANVTLETNSTLISGVDLTGVLNAGSVTKSNVVGTASTDSVVCKGSSSTINLASSTGSVQWQQSLNGTSWSNVLGGIGATTTSYISPSLSATTYYRANVTNATCSSGYTNAITKTVNTNVYTTGWSGNNPPIANDSIEFQGNYTSSSDITGCSCTVTSGNVIISSGNTLNLTDALYVNGGSITFNDTASLLQTNSVANTSYDSSKISFLRKTAPIRRYDYTYWSSPVNNQILLNVSPLTSLDKFFSFDSVINNWANESASNTMVPGKGYIIRGPQSFDIITPSQYTATFNGIPNNGNITIPINGASGIFNLLGNPYPSAIDSETLYEDNNASIKPNFYFWTHNTALTANNYATNDYAIYNAVLGAGIGTGSAAGSGGSAPDRYIDAEQGFFVEGLGIGNVVFKNSHRVAGSNNTFYKQQNTIANSAINNLESDKFWLNITNDLGLFKQQLICYVAGATNGFDDLYDAKELQSNEFVQFHSLSSTNDKYAIQSRVAPFVDQDIVPLGFSSTVVGDFTISLDHFDGLFTNQDMYLVDNYLGIYTNLKQGSYQFSSITGNFNDRFSIQYVVPNLLVPSNSHAKGVLVYSNNNELFIKSFSENINKVDVFDVFGRLIFHENQIDNKLKVIDGIRMKELVFIVIELVNGNKIIKKIFI